MLSGFNKETAPLTDKELATVPQMVDILKRAYGSKNAVFNDQIQRLTGLSSPRVRKVINHIRTNGLVPCLIATSRGYFVAETEEEVVEYEESLMGREMAIKEIRESISKQRAARFHAPFQMTIF